MRSRTIISLRSILLALAMVWHAAGLQAQPPSYPELAALIQSGKTEQLRQELASRTRDDINVIGRAMLVRLAIADGQPDVIAALIDWGLDPNHVLPFGKALEGQALTSPLLYAIHADAGLPVVQALVQGGADPNLAIDGLRPLSLAENLGQRDVAAYLRAHGAEVAGSGNASAAAQQPLHLPPAIERAALKGDNRTLQRWLTPAALARLSEPTRAELLATLIVTGNLDGLTAAVRAGLDPNQALPIEVQGATLRMTALNLALGAPVDDAVALRLVALGADVSAKSVDDNVPLLTAIAVRRYELIEALLARGADPNVGDTLIGATALMLLLHSEQDHERALAVARILVARGAYVDAASTTGHTPLMFAAQAGNEAAVRWLLAAGADRRAVPRQATPHSASLRREATYRSYDCSQLRVESVTNPGKNNQ